MSLRLEMLQVARLAPAVLGEEACELIEKFIFSRQDPQSGGFCDRDAEADLYYTSFAIDALTALQVELPHSVVPFLKTHLESVNSLDFVHRCCLARILSAYPGTASSEQIADLHDAIEAYRAPDGGYNESEDSETGSAYAAFLAWGAYADHGKTAPDPEGIIASLGSLASPDAGAWANDTIFPIPNIPATAAAITLLRNLRQPIPDNTPEWIIGCFQPTTEGGGFAPFPGAPMPDLLTTAVALHALDGLQAEFANLKEPLLDFIDTLWTAEGGFYGTWDDEPEELDIEYTYYGLLALGHLAL